MFRCVTSRLLSATAAAVASAAATTTTVAPAAADVHPDKRKEDRHQHRLNATVRPPRPFMHAVDNGNITPIVSSVRNSRADGSNTAYRFNALNDPMGVAESWQSKRKMARLSKKKGETKADLIAKETARVGTLRTDLFPRLPRNANVLKKSLMKHYIGGTVRQNGSTGKIEILNKEAGAASASSSSSASPSSSEAINNKFAVVMVNNLQYKVSVGDIIAAQRLKAAVGSRIALKKVMMVGGPRFTAIGRPLLANCRIIAEVEEHKRFKGVLNFTHFKGRHHNRFTYNEHAVTMLRIVEVSYDPQIVGEVDRRSGKLLRTAESEAEQSVSDEKVVKGAMPKCYYADELPTKEAPVAKKK